MPLALLLGLFLFLPEEIISLTLKKEIIIIELKEDSQVSVFVDFEMEGSISEKMGLGFPETEFFQLNGFEILWNDAPIKVQKKEAKPNQIYSIGNLSLPAIFHFYISPSNATKHRLITKYHYKALPMSGSKSPKGSYFEFILQTGSKWDSFIEEVQLIIRGKNFDCRRLFVYEDSYSGKCEKNGEYHVLLKNIEPTQDFHFIYQD